MTKDEMLNRAVDVAVGLAQNASLREIDILTSAIEAVYKKLDELSKPA
ncbi:MAG: hypothetical protein HQK97_04565 [Nitrospirae bacterium]|nr:hypothetical protein [Nitrospirota bacterium]